MLMYISTKLYVNSICVRYFMDEVNQLPPEILRTSLRLITSREQDSKKLLWTTPDIKCDQNSMKIKSQKHKNKNFIFIRHLKKGEIERPGTLSKKNKQISKVFLYFYHAIQISKKFYILQNRNSGPLYKKKSKVFYFLSKQQFWSN